MNIIHFKDNYNCCRICLKETTHEPEALDLCIENEDTRSILNKIYKCFQITLDLRIDFPRKICSNCLGELNAANKFRIKCNSFNDRYADKAQSVNTGEMVLSSKSQNLQLEFCDDSQGQTLNVDEHCTNQNELDISDDFKCYDCGKTLKSKASLLKHIVLMHQKRKQIGRVTGFGAARQYHCTVCSYSTPHSQTLVNHMRRHDGKRPYCCHCGKSFTQSSGLRAHLKTHSETTYFTCSKCGKQFKHAFSLKRHLSVHENGTFACNICLKVLKTKQSLQEHIQRHYNIRNYSCEDCGDTFVTSSELIHHRSKHNGKKLECHLCAYKTREKKSLILHMNRHAGNKTFKCEHCEMTFYTQGEARRHQRVHTREKPFTCSTCSQRFAYSPSLNKHMLMVHGIHYKWGEARNKSIKSNLKDTFSK